MEPKIIALMVLIMGGLGTGAWLMTTSAVDTARTELLEVQNLIVSTKTTLANRVQALASKRKEHEDRLKLDSDSEDVKAKVESLNAEIAAAKIAITDTKQRIFEAQSSMAKAIQQVRAAAVGMGAGSLPLKSGMTPADAKITKVEETVLTLSHGQGMMKIQADQLPQPLMDRLRLNRPEAQQPAPPLLAPSEPADGK